MTASAEFVPIESKRFVTVTDRTDLGDIRPGDIVRVRLPATEDEARDLDHDRIRNELISAGASRVQIEPQIVRKDRARVTTVNEQLSQAEALAAWCDANEIDSAMRERMIERLGAWA